MTKDGMDTRGAGRMPGASDIGLAALAAALTLAAALSSPDQPGFRGGDALTTVIALAATLPLIVRRRSPLLVLGTVWTATIAYIALGHAPFTPVLLGPGVATYSAAANGVERQPALGAIGSLLGLIAFFGVAVARDVPPSAPDLVIDSLLFVVAWVLGDRARTRRAHLRALQERAERLERQREAQARSAVLAERSRIARELHDVVAHHVSVMVVQAGAARRVVEREPDLATESIGSIEKAGRQALTELRTLLGALRGDEHSGPLEPQPRLADLRELLERTEASGVATQLEVHGEARALPSGVELSAYRIVQEALTNVLKHAGAASATVRLVYGADRLEIEVRDDGRGHEADAASAGHGLLGMRERVSVFGGTFEAVPLVGGGFRVRASLPLDGARP